MTTREYKFAMNAAVAITAAGIVGKVIDRQAEPDAVKSVEVTHKMIDRLVKDGFKGRIGDRVSIAIPVNAYRVEFVGENGRPDTAWWHEDMLVAA